MQRKTLTQRLTALLALALLPSAMALATEPAVSVINFGVAEVGKGGAPFSKGGIAGLADQRKAIQEALNDERIEVRWHYFKGAGPAVNEALANGQLDFSTQGDLPAVVGKAGGLDTRLLTADSRLSSTYLLVPTNSPAKSLEDLKGKKVALFKGTNLHLAILRAIKHEGLTERDFRSVNMDFATMAAALASGDIDGAWFGPEAYELQDKGVGRIIYDTRAVSPQLTRQSHVLVRSAFEQAHPEIVQKVVNALVKTAAWATDDANRDEVFSLWANAGVPEQYLRAEQQNQDFNARYTPRLDEFFLSRYRTTVEESKELRLIRNDIDIEAWIAPQYVNNAIAELGLESRWPVFDANNQAKAH